MLKILSKREKLILYLAIGLLISAVSFHFLINPILSKGDLLSKEIGIVRTKLIKYSRLLGQKELIQSKYNKLAPGLDVFGAKTETGNALTVILAELENLAKNANIRIVDLRPQISGSTEAYDQMLIELRAEGTIEGYLNFIYNLENSLSLLKIEKFQLNSKSNSSELEGSFSISRFSGL